MRADLHLHTTASDGELTPEQLVCRAAQEGFDLIAVTDHDSMAGIAQAREKAEALGLQVLTGVELSCGAQKEIHILGYGFDPEDAALEQFCARRREQRILRTEEMVRRLCALGKTVSIERVRELARGVMGRPHVARALMEAGHVASVSEAFERYLKLGKPGYVPKEDVRVSEAVRLVHEAGGVAVLAHPMELKMGETTLEPLVHEWKTQGLAGVEVYHPSAQNNHAHALYQMARREGLLVTGGSDFHGEAAHRSGMGEGLERWRTAQEDVSALMAAIQKSRAKATSRD